ncbi:alcohol dehydrogenase [Nitzschia inconspicua]|uniref:Alcohol dehydrogenase n=1 Tax=Nitzschia inconspicua TaxID=303405 RepID=A0A9K3KJ00_9STRA|nr:alcohol dehydrogenase [Nitzschia inconspicua]
MSSTPTIPSQMKAAVCHKIGVIDDGDADLVATPEQISVETVNVPTPEEGEVLVKVHAAAINPVDWKLLNGSFPGKKVGQGLGLDVCGTVVQVGPGVDTFKVGDEVYADIIKTATKSGSFGEYCISQAVAASLKPKSIDFVEAASLPLAGLTALQGLVTYGSMKEGDKVLVLGGSGGVGSLAVQMAKALGAAEVYSTGTSVEAIKNLGADHVINYKEESLMDALKGKDFDVVYDTIGGYEHWEIAQASLKRGGTFVTIAGDGPGTSLPVFLIKVVWRKLLSYFGSPAYKIFLTNSNPPEVVNDMKTITDLVEAGKVKPVLDERRFELTTDSLLDMIRVSMSHRAKGKLVMQVKQ